MSAICRSLICHTWCRKSLKRLTPEMRRNITRSLRDDSDWHPQVQQEVWPSSFGGWGWEWGWGWMTWKYLKYLSVYRYLQIQQRWGVLDGLACRSADVWWHDRSIRWPDWNRTWCRLTGSLSDVHPEKGSPPRWPWFALGIHWTSIGRVFNFPPKGDDLPANEMLSNGSNHTISWKGEALPWCTGDTKAIKNFCDLRFYHAHSHERLEIWSHPQPWDALGCPGMAVEILGHGQTISRCLLAMLMGPLQQLRPGIGAAGYQFLRISGFCWCFKVQLWFSSLACGSVFCCPSFFLGTDLPIQPAWP